MTKSSSTSHKWLIAAALASAFVLPLPAFASIKIVDVMYNPPGADQDHEWIELANTGTSTVNLADYRLFEGGVNHKLTVAVGTSTLAAGAKAIITTDPEQYVADYPSFSGTVFKSSFSLVNSAATIELKDSSSSVVDTYSYTAPAIVKEPTPQAAKNSTSTKKSGTKNSYTYAGSNQTASLAQLPSLPNIPTFWLYGAALVVLVMLGAGAALYARPVPSTATDGGTEEFELE